MKKLINILYFLGIAAIATVAAYLIGWPLSLLFTKFHPESTRVTDAGMVLFLIGIVVTYLAVFFTLMRRRFPTMRHISLWGLLVLAVALSYGSAMLYTNRYDMRRLVSNGFNNYKPLSCTSAQPPADWNTPIDVTACTPCDSRYSTHSMGSRRVSVVKQQGSNCIVEYFSEIEGGYGYSLCTVPKSEKTLSLTLIPSKKNFDFFNETIKQFEGRCKSVKSGSVFE